MQSCVEYIFPFLLNVVALFYINVGYIFSTVLCTSKAQLNVKCGLTRERQRERESKERGGQIERAVVKQSVLRGSHTEVWYSYVTISCVYLCVLDVNIQELERFALLIHGFDKCLYDVCMYLSR